MSEDIQKMETDPGESSVIGALRRKIADLEAEKEDAISAAREAGRQEAEAVATATSLFASSGYPKMVSLFLARKEPPTPEAVQNFLGELGLEPKKEAVQASPVAKEMATAMTVTSAPSADTIISQILGAKSIQEVTAAAKAGGFLTPA